MKKKGIAAYLVTSPADYHYLVGFTGEDSAALITSRDVHLISDGRFDETLNQECPWVTRWMRRGSLSAEIAKTCAALGIRSLAVEADHMTLGDHTEIKRLGNFGSLRAAPPILATMRVKKDPTELRIMRKAIRIAEEAFHATCASIRLGQTELEVAARIEYEMKLRGSSNPAFPTICAEGANAALPHARPGNRRIKRGSAVLIDWGARVGGYCSDLTRVVFVGNMRRDIGDVYSIVLEAQRRAIAAIRPGRRMCDIDAVAREHITEAGFADAFNHGLGHGLGLNVHEAPSLSWRSKEKLEAGMVVTVEPGIYLPGAFGIRIEDDVLVTPTGRRVLSRIAKAPADAVIRARR